MLDRRFIRENPETVRAAAVAKGVALDVDELLRLDETVRSLRREVDEGQRVRRELAREFPRADDTRRSELRQAADAIDERTRRKRDELQAAEVRLTDLLLRTPGIPWEGAPVGPDESANVVIDTWGERPRFDFKPLDHVELAERRGWVEFARARQVAGERAYSLAGDLALLERALHSYALDRLTATGFRMISVPALVREDALVGSGFLPLGRAELYHLPDDDLFLAGTAEVALVGLHAGEVLAGDRLPLLYAGISPCFRREAGGAGRDVRGLLRVHQFEKVEQFVICRADPDESVRWHTALLAAARELLMALGLHHQVVECSTGDMGLGKFRMNDINTWFPSLDTFRETHSCSTLHDWQARRAGIRYREEDGTVRVAHTLNNTAVATPRLLAALIENHQTRDGGVALPDVLRPYMGTREVI